MLRRKLYQNLLSWRGAHGRKALLLTGARQVGKSTLVRKLGNESYDRLVEINLALNDAAREALAGSRDMSDFLRRVSLFAQGPMPHGSTLVFIDEVQELPQIMTMAKALVEDGRYDYAFSGSMLGTEFKGVRSYPVGFVQEMTLRPMDFEEFLWAAGVSEGTIGEVGTCVARENPIDDYLHDAMLAYWRTYLVVGGMPEVVQAFLDSDGDLARVRAIQTDLVKGYQRDIAKYAGRRALNVRAIFDQLPLQLDNDSRRFVLNSIDNEARYEAYRQDFVWIVNAGVGLKTNLVREPRHPLEMTNRPRMFKLYQSDTGMLVSRYPMQTARDIYLDSKSPNLGGVYENALAQELVCGGYDLFYYMGKKRGEVDFVIENDAGAVVPVESKSGRNARAHASLNNLLATEEYALDLGVVFSRLNVERRGKVLYLPWYAVPFIGRAIGGGHEVNSWNLRMTLPIL